MTALILGQGNVPVYETDSDDAASQALCRSLGYALQGQGIGYELRA